MTRDRRRALGLTQEELARRVGVSRQWISGFERGKPGAELRLAIALLDALGVRLMVGSAPSDPSERQGTNVDLDALLDDHRAR